MEHVVFFPAPDGTPAFRRLASLEDAARFVEHLRNVEGGSLWYGHRQARVTTAGTFTPFTLDNESLLPCTNPLGRGEDALFAQVAWLCHPDALVVELPVAIGHLQEGARKRSELTRAAPPPRFNYFIADFVQRQLNEFLAEDPEQRLGLLAENLRDIAGASETRRLRVLREYLAYVRADAIERLQHQFESVPNAPVYWQVGVPLAIVASAAVGYLARGNGWFTTVVVVPAQVLTMMFRSREVGSLWPLTLTLSLFLSLPFVAAAFVGRRLRLRR